MSGDESKQFLYGFLSKNGVTPEYTFRQTGLKNRLRFLCELIVAGYPYRGAGNSPNKKDAQTNAAKDFIQYLIRTGTLNASDIPPNVLGYTPPTPEFNAPPPQQERYFSTQQVFKSGFGPQQMGEGYTRFGGNRPDFDQVNAKNMAEAEDMDVNSSLHGNWTIDSAKGRLHQYMQMNKIKADYTYIGIGPAHARSFQAEMNFYVKELGRPIHARETGSTQKTASKSCALSLVRQLFHLNVIEPFSGSLKRPKESESMKPYPVKIDPNLMASVQEFIGDLNLSVASITDPEETKQLEDYENPEARTDGPIAINLVAGQKKDIGNLIKSEGTTTAGIVSWSPPLPNWNPWTSCNIDEGHMACTSMDQLSEEFLQSFKEVQQSNKDVQQMFEVRSQLPIYSAKAKIMESISEFSVILIKGDTGSGKTTQICQFILDDYILSGQGAYCNVVVTQPRRISAISVAERVAHERGEELGMTVGYSVRFESCLPRPYASVLFCTVGVLLRKLESGLRGVSHVIVDEIHERDVNSDFLLVVLRDMLANYPDLRVILMSATIDHTLFTEYFNGCPVIQVEGRKFAVETYFLEDIVETLRFTPSPESIRTARKKKQEEKELSADDPAEENLNVTSNDSGYSPGTQHTLKLLSEREINTELIGAIFDHIKSLQIPGAILVFLPGWNVIFSIMRYFQNHPVYGSQAYVIIPLHSQLPREDQHRVFDRVPANVTKIILSTNIAETSVTIDDVVFVIDSCKAKVKLFTSHNNMTTFVQMWASKSNLVQRRGRAGRVRPGYCYHLCTKARFNALEENMTPEIFRTPLHEISLTIKLLRLGGISQFLSKAPEPPPLDAVMEAQALLYELNCLNNEGDLTSLGRILAKMPLDPRLGKMIVLGIIFGCGDAIATISANASSMGEIFTLGPENRKLAPQQRAFAAHKHSDHYALLNASQQWNFIRNRKGEDAEYEFCQQKLVSLPSLRMTSDAKNQLLQVASSFGFPEEQLLPLQIDFRSNNSTLDIIAALLCFGLYPNILCHIDKRKVLTTEAKLALIHKASVNCSRFEILFPYPFFAYGEKIRTRAITCKQMTMITPIHMLLFGARKVEFVSNFVRLDNWIKLDMDPSEAAAMLALRPAIENLITEATENPEAFFPMSPDNERLVSLIVSLSRLQSSKFGEDFGEDFDNSSGGEFRSQNYSQPMSSAPAQFQFGSTLDGNGGGGEEDYEEEHEVGVKRNFDEAEVEDSENPEMSFENKRGHFDGRGSRGGERPPMHRGGFSNFRPQGFGQTRGPFQRPFTPRGNGGNFSAISGGGFRSPRPQNNFGGGRSFRGGGGGSGYGGNDRGGPHRFFSTNRGGWSARGGGVPFRGNSRPQRSMRPPRRNYPY